MNSLAALSVKLAQAKKNAKKNVARADHELNALNKQANPAAFLKNDNAIWYYYQAVINYKTSSKWREAGDVLMKIAKLYETLKMLLEAACVCTDAAETYMKIDKGEGMNAMRKAITIYSDIGRFDVAGRLEKKIAYMHFTMKHWDDAAFHYRKAGNFLAGENLIDQSDICFEFSALCHVELHKLEEAKTDFETVAKGALQSNLRRFHTVGYLFRAILCLMGMKMVIKQPPPDPNDKPGWIESEEPILKSIQEATDLKYNRILETISEYKMVDFLWKLSKEVLFLQNIVKARKEWNKHDFADHLYYWNNVKPIDRMSLLMFKEVYQEFINEFQRREIRIKRLDAQKLRRERRKEKMKEAKKLMQEMGLTGPVEIEEDEEDKRLSAIIAGDRKLIKVDTQAADFTDSDDEKEDIDAENEEGAGDEGGAEGEEEVAEEVEGEESEDDDDEEGEEGEEGAKRKTRKKKKMKSKLKPLGKKSEDD